MRIHFANCLICFIAVVMAATVRGAWLKSDRDSYPRSLSKYANGDALRNSRNGLLTNQAVQNRLVNVLQPAKQVAGVGIVVALLYGAAQKLQLFKYLRLNRTIEVSENDFILKVKKEQEELWNAILSIHNTQKESKASIDALEQSSRELSEANENTTQKLDGILARMDDIDRSLLETSESVSELLNSTESKELENKLRGIEDTMEKETVALRASLRQLREEVPVLMSKHDDMVTSKLSKFKEDLKRLLGNVSKKK